MYEPGQSLRFRYRIIVHAGDVQSAKIADEWTRYSAAK